MMEAKLWEDADCEICDVREMCHYGIKNPTNEEKKMLEMIKTCVVIKYNYWKLYGRRLKE